MEKLTIIEDGQDRVVELDIDEITIGRAVDNIIQITEKRSSRTHCRIEQIEDGYQVTDLGTANGTRVNGLRIEGSVDLIAGDEIEIGDMLIRFGAKPAVDEFAPTAEDPNAKRSPAPIGVSRSNKKRSRRKSSTKNPRKGGEIDIDEVGERAINWVQRYAVALFAAGITLIMAVVGVSALLSSMTEGELKKAYAKTIKTADSASTVDEKANAIDRLKIFQRKVDDAGFSTQFGALTAKRITALEKDVKHLRDADRDLNQLKLNRKTLDWPASRYYVRLLSLRDSYADTPTIEEIDSELKGVNQELREELQQRYLKARAAVLKRLTKKEYQQAFSQIARFAAGLGEGLLSKDPIVSDFREKANSLSTEVRAGMKKDYEQVVDWVKDALLVKNFTQARRALSRAVSRFGNTPYEYYIKRDIVAIRLMATRKITSFAEARKISDKRSKWIEKIEKAKKLISQRKYEQASELLGEIGRDAGGDVAQETAQQLTDIRRFLALRKKLINQINTGQLKETSYQFAGQKMTIVQADDERVRLKIGSTGSTARTWKSMTARDLYDFFLMMDLLPTDYETMGIFCFYHDMTPRGHRSLIKAMKLDFRSHRTKNRVFDLYARLSHTPKPDNGFVIYSERIMTPREKEMKQYEERASKLAAEMTRGSKSQRMVSFNRFQDTLKSARTKFGEAFAKELKTNVITKLEKQRKVLLASLKGDSGLGNIQQLRALKTELNRRRAYAKKLIYDEKAYPYDACHGCKAQPEVDKRVNAVRELWDNPFASSLVGAGVKGKSDRIKEINSQLKGLGVAADTGGLNLGYIAALANKKMNIQNFGLNGKEQKLIVYNHKVYDGNKAMNSHATNAEKKQVEVTNDYRHMMGHHCVYIDDRLVKAARGHSAYMQSSGKFAHNIPGHPDGASPGQRCKKAGYTGNASENISMGRTGPKAVHNAWYNSSGHHRNLLKDTWRVMGAGQAGKYWTQNFGATK